MNSHHVVDSNSCPRQVALDVKTAHSGITNTKRSEFWALSAQRSRNESAFVLLFDNHILFKTNPNAVQPKQKHPSCHAFHETGSGS